MSNIEEKVKSKTQQIKEYYLAHQSESYDSISERFKTTKGFIMNKIAELRKEGKLPKLPEDYRQKKPIEEKHAALVVECERDGLPPERVTHYWWKTKDASIFVKCEQTQESDILKSIEDIVTERLTTRIKIPSTPNETCQKALKVTISDAHIGLDPNPNGYGIYNYKYNADIFFQNLDSVYNSVMAKYNHFGKFDTLFIDDLGDGLDGWNGLTTRGGHDLPQNMSNVDAFKTFVTGKLNLIERLIAANVSDNIECRNVSNDNHSGDFARIANETIKMVLDRIYGNGQIGFKILNKFVEHFFYGDHCFILTHGKDEKQRVKNLSLDLTPAIVEFFRSYIDYHGINSKFIHVDKGDLHQLGYKRCNKFDYRNYMSFAPPSFHSSHNYNGSYSGYSIQVIDKHSATVSHEDYFFDLTKL
jgi:transposase